MLTFAYALISIGSVTIVTHPGPKTFINPMQVNTCPYTSHFAETSMMKVIS